MHAKKLLHSSFVLSSVPGVPLHGCPMTHIRVRVPGTMLWSKILSHGRRKMADLTHAAFLDRLEILQMALYIATSGSTANTPFEALS